MELKDKILLGLSTVATFIAGVFFFMFKIEKKENKELKKDVEEVTTEKEKIETVVKTQSDNGIAKREKDDKANNTINVIVTDNLAESDILSELYRSSQSRDRVR